MGKCFCHLTIDGEEYEVKDSFARKQLEKITIEDFDNIADMKSSITLKDGNIVKTLGYYERNDNGGATYKIRTKLESDIEDNGSIHFIGNLVAELICKKVNVKQFGAYGNNENDDITTINNAIKYCLDKNKPLVIPYGQYKVSSTIELPKNTLIESQNAYIYPTFNDGAVLSCNLDGYTIGTQPSYNVKGRLRISGPTDTNTLVGLLVGSSKNSIFENITITECHSAGIKLFSNLNGDVDNPNFINCHCYNTGGIVIETGNNSITRGGNITDGSFRNCIIDSSFQKSAVNIIKSTNKAIFGILFERCFLNSSNYPVLSINKLEGVTGYIDYLKFDECTVEIRNSSNNPLYAVIDSCTNSIFDLKGQLINTSGFKITNSNNCEFNRIEYFGYAGLNDKILDIDEKCENINFKQFKIPAITYMYEGEYKAVLRNELYKMIVDNGKNTKIDYSMPFQHVITTLNKHENLLSLTSDEPKEGYSLRCSTGTIDEETGSLKVTLQSGQNSPRIELPNYKCKSKYVGVHVRYKLLQEIEGSGKLRIIPFENWNIILPTTVGEWIDVLFIMPYTPNNSYLGIDGTIDNDVDILVDKLEFIEGCYLPYFKNYQKIEQNQ